MGMRAFSRSAANLTISQYDRIGDKTFDIEGVEGNDEAREQIKLGVKTSFAFKTKKKLSKLLEKLMMKSFVLLPDSNICAAFEIF